MVQSRGPMEIYADTWFKVQWNEVTCCVDSQNYEFMFMNFCIREPWSYRHKKHVIPNEFKMQIIK